MAEKVLLILCDGARPDAIENCRLPFVEKLMGSFAYTHAHTVFPSITLPCHMSLFQSTDPSEHGVIENIFVPVSGGRHGLFEQLHSFGKSTAMFYSWGELKDLYEPYSISFSSFVSSLSFGGSESEKILSEGAADLINSAAPDFVFLYLENTDAVGHKIGWNTPEYMDAIRESYSFIEKLLNEIPDDYSVIITSDHGGHDLTHGTHMPEDMTIPVFVKSPFEIDAEKFGSMSIIDIAPSICELCGIAPSKGFKGRSIFKK